MHETEIVMLEESFSAVFSVRDDAAALFYERLFANDPSLKRMFAQTDMREQGKKLMSALQLVVVTIRKIDTVKPALRFLAVKHAGYGVRDEHYATVGTALIETLSLFFGERFTPELRRVWSEAYGIVSTIMIDAVHEQQDAEPLSIAS
ncbi:globin family protein [Bosea sp. PAMC 26642]|uniref:globin family protein n=1 Tax=Bosea sp. (strain PAMC 26642) TaxID=1792307 RepID=UPI00076FFEC6|nr:globin family protein [Bosea sp. PAMC 26642]AMJ61776.1 hemin receptor [Bosea sp. PAMC 26642]